MQLGLECSQQGQYALAVDYLDNAVRSDPSSADALFARAKARQRLGEFSAAADDYHAAYQLVPRPLFAACKGYCLSRAKSHAEAVVFYGLALKGNYGSPALLYNNIGFSYLQLKRLPEAEDNLRRAIEIDGNLPAAYENLMKAVAERAMRTRSVASADLALADRAAKAGPRTARLYRDLAILYAIAARRDPSLTGRAVKCVQNAVQPGPRSETL